MPGGYSDGEMRQVCPDTTKNWQVQVVPNSKKGTREGCYKQKQKKKVAVMGASKITKETLKLVYFTKK